MAGQPRKRAKEAAAALADREDATAEAPPAGAGDGQAERPPADRPPRAARPRKRSAPPAGDGAPEPGADRRPAGIRKIQDGLVQLFTLAGLGVSMFVDDFDGQVVALNAERLSRAWADLAQQSPAVRKALESLLMGSAWGSAVGTTAMVAVPILVRHGMAPPEVMAMAAGQGVKVPNIGQADPNDLGDPPPAPAAFRPDPTPTPQPAPADEQRHPLDGSPLNGSAPADPTAPMFPQGDHGEQAA